VTLIVNVASACGYTAANYAGLQARTRRFVARSAPVPTLVLLCCHSRCCARYARCVTHARCAALPQELHAALAPRGFAVLAFPCDCFGNQEPGSDAEIKAFAEDKYGVTFPLFSKVAAVNGADAHPVFDWLALQNGFEAEVSWNFNKWLIGRNGKPLKRYGPAWDGDAIRADAEDALKVAYEEADAF
jgi:glutathione peroxidase